MHAARHERTLRHISPGTFLIPLFLLLVLNPAAVAEEEMHASLTVEREDGTIVPLPLQQTEVQAEISGFVASVRVTQTYGNPFDAPIEATYLFPLPERAAVDDFLLEVGDRRVVGRIERREEAERIYVAARAAGHTAALLHQERPNIFTQKVANILPGEIIRVHIRYIDRLPYESGAYRFLFPMVVGPRFFPGPGPLELPGSPEIGGPASVAPAALIEPVCDALRIDPPVLKPGTRSGHDIALSVAIDAGVPLRSVTSDSHDIVVERKGSRARVGLAPYDTIPNKDFMLRLEVAGDLPEVGTLAHRIDEEGFFALLIQPKAEVGIEEAAPKEILFVLDESGSMGGLPIEMSKRFMRRSLESLAPQDRFNIIKFSGSADVLARAPLENTTSNVKRGLEAIEKMKGRGGTQMLAGFRAAFEQPHDPATIRIVFFLTDGFIGNEEQIFEAIRKYRGEARIFTLGIGSSVNHYLLREMADLGHGAYQYIRPDGNEKEAVDRFQRWVTRPYLTDLEIDWGSLAVEDVQPARLPDLYSGQTLSIVGRYLWGGEDTLIIRGRLAGVPWEKEIPVALPEIAPSHAALASVWARERIRTLLLEPETTRPEIRAQVTSLALAFRLMSPYTSFVAVDEERIANPDGAPLPVEQAIPLPEFVSFTGVFGEEPPARDYPLVAAPITDGIAGYVTDTSGAPLSGVVVLLEDRGTGSIPAGQAVSNDIGIYHLGGVRPGDSYFLVIDHPRYAKTEMGPLAVADSRVTSANLTLRSGLEIAEAIVIESRGNIVEPEGAPIIGHNYQDVLAMSPGVTDTDGDGNPNVHGARATTLQSRQDGGNVIDPAAGTFGENLNADMVEESEVVISSASVSRERARNGIVGVITKSTVPSELASEPLKLSLSILADILDDGRLSRSEGFPALAGLLAIQFSDGAFTPSIAEQAIALWALAEVSEAQPEIPWVSDAARKAREFLEAQRLENGTWPAIAGNASGDGDATRWALFALASSDRRQALPEALAGSLRNPDPKLKGQVARILAGLSRKRS